MSSPDPSRPMYELIVWIGNLVSSIHERWW